MSPRVELIAYTALAGTVPGYKPHENDWPTAADELAEMAGRGCYQSWERPNPETATNAGYLSNIRRQQHFSVLEHASATVHISDVSRNFTHELVRHRHMSFSQLSQRYADHRDSRIAGHPDFGGLDRSVTDMIWDLNKMSTDLYGIIVDELEKKGVGHKRARQAARQVLPGGTETEILVTGNHRSWRELIQKRLQPSADLEFQEVAKEILKVLYPLAPNTYADLANDLLGLSI